jgi:hypothetical protein
LSNPWGSSLADSLKKSHNSTISILLASSQGKQDKAKELSEFLLKKVLSKMIVTVVSKASFKQNFPPVISLYNLRKMTRMKTKGFRVDQLTDPDSCQ